MSTPNPLAPQGSLLEQQAKGRSTFHVISFIGAVHVMLLCGILWTACGRDEKAKTENPNTIGGTDPATGAPADPGAAAPLPGAFGGLPPVAATNPAGFATTPPAGPAGAGNFAPPPGAGSTPSASPVGGNVNSASSTPTPPALPPSNPAPGTSAPVPTNDTAAAPAGPAGEYKVAKGDIGESIAKKHGVSLKALTTANPSINWSRLKVGQTIQIPAATAGTPTPGAGSTAPSAPEAVAASGTITYTVKAGDTGTKIATKHGVKWSEIRHASHLSSDALHPGQKLTIPAHSAGAAAPKSGGAATTSTSTPLPPSASPVPRTPGQ